MIYLNFPYIYNSLFSWIEGLLHPSVATLFMMKVSWFVIGTLAGLFALNIYRKRQALGKVEAEEIAEAVRQKTTAASERANEPWEKIMKYMASENPSDWKLAILEADTILDAIVQKMGYRGENLGERLKSVEPSDFLTLNDAWEAHKVRNAIAHEAGYDLTQREARRVIKLFENVFKEFGYL